MALGKKVKTVMLGYDVGAVAGGDLVDVVGMEHVFQDDVRVIGILLRCDVEDETDLDSGYLALNAEVSRASKRGQAGALIMASCKTSCRSCTVGIGVTETVLVESHKVVVVMFPDGHGVDFDDGEYINLLVYMKNTMSNAHSGDANAIIYFVER